MLTRTIFAVVLFAVLKCCHAQPLPVISVATPASSAVFSDWANRVQTNGGARPSDASIAAANSFLNGLTNDSLDTLIFTCNFFAPDSLTAAITPLIVGGSHDPWFNSNMVTGDLTVNGLKGNGTTKLLNTGLAPNSVFTATDCGLVIYVYDNTGNTGVDIGEQQQASVSVVLLANQTGSTTAESYNFTAGQGLLSTGGALGNGYTAMFRKAANVFNIYFANSGTAHASVASSATTGGSITGLGDSTYVFALDLVNPTPAACCWSSSRLSFAAMTKAMTATQSSNLFQRVQTLRTSLGGGYR